MVIRFLLLTIFVLLGACATQYVVPTSGPIAKLRVVTQMKEGGNIPVVQYEHADCSDHPGNRFAFLNSYAIGTHFSSETTTVIAAQKPFIFSVYAVPIQDITPSNQPRSIGITIGWCAPVIEFSPQEGAEYVAIHNATRTNCSIAVYKVNPQTGEQTPEPSAHVDKMCSQTLRQQ